MLQSVLFPLALVGLPVLLLSGLLNPLMVRTSENIPPDLDSVGSSIETGDICGEVGGLLKDPLWGAAVNARSGALLTVQNFPVLSASGSGVLACGFFPCRII